MVCHAALMLSLGRIKKLCFSARLKSFTGFHVTARQDVQNVLLPCKIATACRRSSQVYIPQMTIMKNNLREKWFNGAIVLLTNKKQ